MAARRGTLVVFGATGFVGSHVAQEGVKRGLDVICLSRKGVAPAAVASATWSKSVKWAAADALKPGTYRDQLQGADAVVISIGSPPLPFVDRGYQVMMNGETNVTIAREAKAMKVPQIVAIGAAMPFFVKQIGYGQGKLMMEAEAQALADPACGTAVLKPGAIYGTRFTSGGTPIPLWLAMAPASAVLKHMPAILAANAPVSVEKVAAAAVDAATLPEYRGKFTEIDNLKLLNWRS